QHLRRPEHVRLHVERRRGGAPAPWAALGTGVSARGGEADTRQRAALGPSPAPARCGSRGGAGGRGAQGGFGAPCADARKSPPCKEGERSGSRVPGRDGRLPQAEKGEDRWLTRRPVETLNCN